MSGLMQWSENGLIREMSNDGTRPKHDDCRETSIRFLAGSGVTDASGDGVLQVADAVCEQVGLVGSVSFMATATFDPLIDSIPRPSYIMTANTHSGGYVTPYARSWDCHCEPLPDVPFDYHVAISYDFVTALNA